MKDKNGFIWMFLIILIMFILFLFTTIGVCKSLNNPDYVIIGKVERIGLVPFFYNFVEFKAIPTSKEIFNPDEKMYANIRPYASIGNIEVGSIIKIRYFTNDDGSIKEYVVWPPIKEGINFCLTIFIPLLIVCIFFWGISIYEKE